jgi:hypothetical protein
MHESICRTDGYGNKHWYLNDKLHRLDGPAIELANGNKQWCLDGEIHRTDGPAIEWADGNKTWYLHGILYSFDEFVIEMNWTTEQIAIWKLQYA